MRVTGVALFVLALAHFSDPAFHLGPGRSKLPSFIANQRWNQIFWRGFDWLLLMIVLFHGFLGMRTVVLDYVHAPQLARVHAVAALRDRAAAVRDRHAGRADAAVARL